MHLVVRDRQGIDETAAAQDLDLAPADSLFLSFSDSDLSQLADAWQRLDAVSRPSLRLVPLGRLRHPLSVDLFIEKTARHARTIVVRLLGGIDYWRYGVEQLGILARRHAIRLALLAGDGREDPGLAVLSSFDTTRLGALFQAGGPDNLARALAIIAGLSGDDGAVAGVPLAGIHRHWGSGEAALIVFYRALLMAGDLEPVDQLGEALANEGVKATALYLPSLKDTAGKAFLADWLGRARPRVIVNLTAFSAREDGASPLDAADCAVVQAALALSDRRRWSEDARGLSAQCLAMNVVLPEADGRIFAGAISFKEGAARDVDLGVRPSRHRAEPEMVRHVARLAANWARLKAKPPAERRLALVLSTYPGRPDQIAHAVGLDGPESAAGILAALKTAGYGVEGAPADGAGVVARLGGPGVRWPLASYLAAFAGLGEEIARQVTAAWGPPEDDPLLRDGAFALPVHPLGSLALCLQPERGLGQRKALYHDVNAPPCHSYIAFYLYLRQVFGIDALVHLGTHGTLEWLPGKAVALSADCFPRALIGATPVINPFIVSDPGEAAQARRRVGAVTIGHLTPPLKRGELFGALKDVERLVDEFAAAEGLDPRRRMVLAPRIVDAALAAGIGPDVGVEPGMDAFAAIMRIDAFLCDLKELSIRDGLHVFGRGAPGEIDGLMRALDGRFVAPGPSGAPSRGRADVLPTGRNLFALDPRALPTRTAADNGQRAAETILERYFDDHGDWPRAMVIDLWGSASIRTGGEELATALWLMGVRPQWDDASFRVSGIEAVGIAELGRPRVDVTLRISGLFRDMFPAQLDLFAAAVRTVAARGDEDGDNPLALSVGPHDRIFGTAPGSYGAGVTGLIDSGDWDAADDLGQSWLAASATVWHGADAGKADAAGLESRLREADALVHIHDHRDSDILMAPDYAAHQGGMLAAARRLGREPMALHADTSDPARPVARTLREEASRVLVGRAAAAGFIDGQMRHGHAGAAELARTLDSAFAFAATAGVVTSAHFERLYEAYLGDITVANFLGTANPQAREAIRARFADAIRRGLFVPRRNSIHEEVSS